MSAIALAIEKIDLFSLIGARSLNVLVIIFDLEGDNRS